MLSSFSTRRFCLLLLRLHGLTQCLRFRGALGVRLSNSLLLLLHFIQRLLQLLALGLCLRCGLSVLGGVSFVLRRFLQRFLSSGLSCLMLFGNLRNALLGLIFGEPPESQCERRSYGGGGVDF